MTRDALSLGIVILAASCTLPIASLLFAAELFEQGAAIRVKADEQLTAAAENLGAIAGNMLSKRAKALTLSRNQTRRAQREGSP